ncbi:hypothetical protein [Actinoalloteichus hymeniacidonis]|uniref:Uncharacterized protein n=1 Tax=Actinoalloteichus hymeniacidonis TaxID=340345 RepID=A0AAC9MZK9_9PSEU|nr:hypothetical protein [Actinoalloteichus hymeniacidonis]AOS65518.1 hypothetical protein TL08_23690 [Actinoalloteichus hymeniacidonis]MBB5906394.1 hypothetical protein [Actinoalloteichus hymeniacidonis]
MSGPAEEPMLIEQDVCPMVGLILDRHLVFVDTGQPVPTSGDRVTALCGTPVTIGPRPAEVLPGIPATHAADCPDCRVVLEGRPPEIDTVDEVIRLFLRRTSATPVHIVEIEATTTPSPMLIARCGEVFDGTADQVTAGDGMPCTLCLLLSLSRMRKRESAPRWTRFDNSCRVRHSHCRSRSVLPNELRYAAMTTGTALRHTRIGDPVLH